jgi:hypothetical protein
MTSSIVATMSAHTRRSIFKMQRRRYLYSALLQRVLAAYEPPRRKVVAPINLQQLSSRPSPASS